MTKITRGFEKRYQNKPMRLIAKIMIRSNGRCLSGNAIWDTGATHLMITRRVIDALCLVPVEERDIETPFGVDTINGYRVDVVLSGGAVVQDIIGYEVDMRDEKIIALVGMDLINRGTMSLTPDDGGMVFKFSI